MPRRSHLSALLAGAMFLVVFSVASAQVAPFTAYGTGLTPGQKVEAFIGSATCGIAKVDLDGNWLLQIGATTKCAPQEGSKITFKVDGLSAEGHAIWTQGGAPEDIANGITLVVPENAGKGTFATTLFKGVNITIFSGGTVESAVEAATGLKSMWVSVGGMLYGYIAGSPDFVNATFLGKFTAGIPDGTPMVVIIQ